MFNRNMYFVSDFICKDLVTTTPVNTKLGKSQAAESSATEIIIAAVVSACVFVFIVIVATVYYCKKSKAVMKQSLSIFYPCYKYFIY